MGNYDCQIGLNGTNVPWYLVELFNKNFLHDQTSLELYLQTTKQVKNCTQPACV